MTKDYFIAPSESMSTIRTRIMDVFSMARICKWRADELDAHLQEQITLPMQSRTPGGRLRHSIWLQGWVSGVIHAERERLWQEVEFCYRDKDGVVYSTHRDSTRRTTEEFYARNEGHLLGSMECAHLWKGSDKEYTAWKTV